VFFTALLILVFINIHLRPFNNCVSRNNTLIEAHYLFRNKTPIETAIQFLLESISMQLVSAQIQLKYCLVQQNNTML